MRKTNLLICSNCRRNIRWKGRGNGVGFTLTAMPVLGEITETGDIIIKRGGLFVIIQGSNFEVICGFCQNKIFYRERRSSESNNFGNVGFSGVAFSEGTFSEKLPGSTN